MRIVAMGSLLTALPFFHYIFPIERFWHLGTLRTAQRRGHVRSFVDDRISRATKKFFSLAKSVWKERAHSFFSRRVFLREVLQCLEWSLHTVALDAVHFQEIESAERRFFPKRFLSWGFKTLFVGAGGG